MQKKRKILVSIMVLMVMLLIGMGIKYGLDYKLSKEQCIEQEEKYNNLNKSVDKLILNESEKNEIDKLIKEIEELLATNDYKNKKLKLDTFNKRIDELSKNSKKIVENNYNKISVEYLDSYTDDERANYDSYINDYMISLKESNYSKANSILQKLSEYVDNINIVASERSKAVNGVVNEEGVTKIKGILLVNKDYPLPNWYNYGEDSEALSAFNEMVTAASGEGIYLHKISSFRSYDNQAQIYNNYVAMYGEEYASSISAQAGTSEHQSGLSFDIGGVDQGMWLMQEFKDTSEGKWLRNNAYKYGFILRFPEGKEHITKYIFEPWHYRYIGKEYSANFKEGNLTLEEYLGMN